MTNKKTIALALYLLVGTLIPSFSETSSQTDSEIKRKKESKIEKIVKNNSPEETNVNPINETKEYLSEIEKITQGLNNIGYFSTNTPKSRIKYYNETNVAGVKINKKTKSNEPVEFSGLASFYFPGSNKDPYSGGNSAAVGVKFSKFDAQGIITVAGSDRFFKMGDYIEVINVKNGKSKKVLVVDRFASWIVRKKPNRLIDVRQDTKVSQELGLGYGLPDVRIKRLGRFNYKNKKWFFEEYDTG